MKTLSKLGALTDIKNSLSISRMEQADSRTVRVSKPDPDPAQNLDADPDPDPGGGRG